ncbi:hypothetical protein FBZ91_11412 [Nitrospirillum viridazoti]|nr:hypothetical protein FBZ91_11412 [Nitrospirillum amazonense]
MGPPGGVGMLCFVRFDRPSASLIRICIMDDIDTDRIDEAVLALLHLGLHDEGRTWKTFDWEAMNRLHAKGFISDPIGKTKSVVFTEVGARRAEELFRQLFARRS